MKTTLLAMAAMAGFAGLAPSLFAQDDPKPIVIGDFDNSGSVTAGYRFTDVTGYRPMFQQLFDMNGGFRVTDFSLFGRAHDGTTPFADSYSLVVSGLGGDPWTTAQLSVKKKNLYELRADFRQSHYYFNENDAAVLPGATLSSLTSNHNWATVRKMGSVNLLVHATNNLRFSFEYYRNTREGVMDTTQTFDFFGSPASFGSFARANPYYLIAPLTDSSNRVTGGVDYTLRSWTLHYKVGMQSFQESINAGNASTGERSINSTDPTTANERLTTGTWTDYRRLNTPVSELSWNGKMTHRLRSHGSYLAYRYSGPTGLDMSAAGSARTTGTTTAPYSLSESSQGSVAESNQIVEQGFSYELSDWLSAEANYKYSRSTLGANANFFSVYNGVTASGITTDTWAVGTHLFDYDMVVTPAASLTVHVGVRYLKSDVEYREAGVADPLQSKRMKTVWPSFSLRYEPSKKLSIRADVDEVNSGTPYTRISPHTDVGSRFVARYHPFAKVWLDNTTTIRDSKQLDVNFESTVRTNATTATWDFSDRISGFGGFSYDSFFASGTINFLRGPAPFTNLTVLDQTVDRVWQGGLRAVPVKRLTLEFSGNYVRVTGLGQVQGEPPLYGPMKFPYAAGSLAYDFPQVGKLMVQLQRAYYAEQIVPGNNFSSNILLVAWKRSF